MPDSAGFGDYTESGVVIPALFEGEPVNFTAQMYPDDEPPIAGSNSVAPRTGDTPRARVYCVRP